MAIKNNKEPMYLIGHMGIGGVTFAMYIHVYDNYRANEIIFNVPGLLNPINIQNSNQIIKTLQHNKSDIIEKILSTKKQ